VAAKEAPFHKEKDAIHVEAPSIGVHEVIALDFV
jgi:hypothetical protein